MRRCYMARTLASLISLIPIAALAAPAPLQLVADEPHIKARPDPAQDSPLRIQLSLDATGGYAVHYLPLYETGVHWAHGAVVEASLSLLLSRRPDQATRVGLRFQGLVSPKMTGEWASTYYDEDNGSRLMWGLGGGFLVDHRGLWFSTGLELIFLNVMPDVYDPGEISQEREGNDLFVPELYFSLGYDIKLHKHVALRLGAKLGTLFVTCRLQGAAGLVFRF